MLDVTVILLSDSYASTAIGPIEVFHSAGLLWHTLMWHTLNGTRANPRFRVTIASPKGEAVNSPYALGLIPQVALRKVKRADLVIVPASGLDLDNELARNAMLLPWLRKQAAQGAHIAGICTGVVFLAEAGLLERRQATTHWALADQFRRRYPRVDWHPEKFITEDRRMLCSGGVYASMDLSLYLVEKFCGHEVALQCAKALLINMPRPSQSGYATLPLSRPHNDEKVRVAESFLERHYAEDVSLELLAQDLGMSPRNFSRRFKRATGRLPGNYLQARRVAIAKEMLEGGARSVAVVSAAVGYEDAAFFRGLFKRATGMTPGEYRENFAGSNGARCLGGATPRRRRHAR
ncbi:MAG TPA: helix-turn-helix domain-containing protein [Hyphomicrobiaceae bacterium]|nr:helix-turn-helix domain-containing protein [Hyphomicrobiaceae bacterium]